MVEQTALARTISEDERVLAALRVGDEQAFLVLVQRLHPSMLHVALAFVPSRAVAEEVVQEAWLGVLKGLAQFEGRSSLRRWCSAPTLWSCQCIPASRGPYTWMRYKPTLRLPSRGSRVITSPRVMYGPPSPGQQVSTGKL